MIDLNVGKAQYISYGQNLYTVILDGTFKDIDTKEFRFLTCNPSNLLITEKFEYDTFSYRLLLREKSIKKFLWFFKKEVVTEYNVQIYSINSMMNYMYSLPSYSQELYGEFTFEMIISKENYKKYIFYSELNKILSDKL